MDRRYFIRTIVGVLCVLSAFVAISQPMSLDSCRRCALQQNKSLLIADELVRQSGYLVKAARGAYAPNIDFTGGYFYNQKALQLVDVDHIRSLVSSLGVPSSITSALIPDDLFRLDTHHVFAGAVSVVQPIFMGGKIIAANAIADNVEKLSLSQRQLAADEVITAVDEAYWLVVSLARKLNLAYSYVELIDTLRSNVSDMINEGVATRMDELTVEVARNEAQVQLVQARNGLSLSRMLLAQLCGMPIDTVFTLQDEVSVVISDTFPLLVYGMDGVYARREELRSMEYLINIAQAQQHLALSEMLPSLALVGAYTFNTPNLYNGFKTSVDGTFRVGVLLRVPLIHWGTDYYRYKASRGATVVARLEKDVAMERIELQVNSCRYKYVEAVQTYKMTAHNVEQAQQNLDNARLAYSEGVYTLVEVMTAQTAWYQAQSMYLDAGIAVAVARDNYTRAVGFNLY